MFKRPELSKIVYTKNQIIVHGFQESIIHPGYFLPDKLKESFDRKPRVNLYLKGNKVGESMVDLYHADQKSIFLYFKNLSPTIKFENYWAGMELDCSQIQCPSCKTYFVPNDQPCKCVKGAPFYIIPKFTLESVHLFDLRTDYIDSYDCREKIYSKFFGGSLHNLKILEPI